MKFINKVIIVALLSGCSNGDIRDNIGNKYDEKTKEEIKILDSIDVISPKGSQILSKSHKSFEFYNLTGLWLSSVNFTKCDEFKLYMDLEYVIKKIRSTDSILEISFSLLARCGSSFLFEVELLDKGTLNILCHAYDSFSDCRCMYDVEYLLTNKDYLEGLNMDKISLKYISLNNGERHLISSFYNE
jgi:hypothetical protein